MGIPIPFSSLILSDIVRPLWRIIPIRFHHALLWASSYSLQRAERPEAATAARERCMIRRGLRSSMPRPMAAAIISARATVSSHSHAWAISARLNRSVMRPHTSVCVNIEANPLVLKVPPVRRTPRAQDPNPSEVRYLVVVGRCAGAGLAGHDCLYALLHWQRAGAPSPLKLGPPRLTMALYSSSCRAAA
jgi:hypothetical protein